MLKAQHLQSVMSTLLARLQQGHNQNGIVFWNPPGYSQVSVPARVDDLRRVFNRVDCLIHVMGRPQTEQVWVSLETISGVPFEDLL